ncbi:hypothetical protein [Aquabacter cavernae]|uniref:hypothetical protein n=1 Tax=Aquabacter cavernae TaxID=2496029 RepID=UPI000F8F7641|nr:hypothetical protein [Aquabacter cavernae]
MWRFMVGLGLLLALAGLVVVALGVAIFVSSFGNTLIAAGAVFLSGGITLAAVGLVMKQLLDMSERLDAALAGGTLAAARPLDAADEDFASSAESDLQDEAEEYYEEEEEEPAPAPAQPPRSYVPPSFARQPAPAPERPVAPPEPYRPEPPRSEFARPEPARPEPSRAEMPRTEQTRMPEALQRGRVLGRTPEGEHFADRMRPQPAFVPPAPEPEAPVERAPERPVERAPMVTRPFTPPSRRPDQGVAPVPPAAPAPSAPAFTPPAPYAPPAPPAPVSAAEPTVLKSGVVGGMAYTLYSDGSIQAELPDGALRFASLQELREHVARSQQG